MPGLAIVGLGSGGLFSPRGLTKDYQGLFRSGLLLICRISNNNNDSSNSISKVTDIVIVITVVSMILTVVITTIVIRDLDRSLKADQPRGARVRRLDGLVRADCALDH